MRAISMTRRVGAVSIFLLSLTGCGPIGPFAGARLAGEIGAPRVESWSFARAEQTAQLETRPEDPHSVNTWFVGVGSGLYVPTSMIRGPKQPGERSWVKNVQESPLVRIRIAGIVYERAASRVLDESEYGDARSALEQKYELDPSDRDPERVIWIYRLDPRS